MCGVTGTVDFNGMSGDHSVRVTDMVATLRHRGPDQNGVWSDDHAALGHARLSIIDLSDGRQPMSNEDGTIWVTFNGEIYNFLDLRGELEAHGHRFRTRSDTEVLVHLYEEHGIEGVHRLRGMFAYGLWDSRRQVAYLVRDQIGIKPLYYWQQGSRIVFGSEIKAILAHGGIERKVCGEALSDYLTFLYVPAPKTMFEGIYKLPPGHWLRFDRTGAHVQQYWDLKHIKTDGASEAHLEAELVDRLKKTVASQLISEVPLGAFLSGGVDSSAVVAMMSLAGQQPLITTSVGFREQKYNELPFARAIAQRYKTEHYEELVEPEAASIVETLAWHYDEPFADYSAIPTYYVSQATRRHVTVALSGDGGDENFAGYRRYRFDLAERRIRNLLPSLARRALFGSLGWLYPKADYLPRPLRAKATLVNIACDAAEAYCRSVGFLDDQAKQPMLSGDLRNLLRGYRSADIIRHYMALGGDDDMGQLTYVDFKTYLVDDILTKVDRASMAVSLEVRPPMLDVDFVEFAQRLPARMKIRKGQGKVILKSAMRPYVNHDILYRPKQGFTPPLTEWMRGPLREMIGDLLLSPSACYRDYLSQDAVRGAWQAHQNRMRDYTPLLWAVLMFELWNRKFLTDRQTHVAGAAS